MLFIFNFIMFRRIKMSGKGFEPSTLGLRVRCANQAALTAHNISA